MQLLRKLCQKKYTTDIKDWKFIPPVEHWIEKGLEFDEDESLEWEMEWAENEDTVQLPP